MQNLVQMRKNHENIRTIWNSFKSNANSFRDGSSNHMLLVNVTILQKIEVKIVKIEHWKQAF